MMKKWNTCIDGFVLGFSSFSLSSSFLGMSPPPPSSFLCFYNLFKMFFGFLKLYTKIGDNYLLLLHLCFHMCLAQKTNGSLNIQPVVKSNLSIYVIER